MLPGRLADLIKGGKAKVPPLIEKLRRIPPTI